MDKRERKEVADRRIERRMAEIEETKRQLSRHGRQVVRRFIGGNVRTYIWANLSDGKVPVLVEQIRLYSTMDAWGSSRGMEASDMLFAVDGLDQAAMEILGWRVPPFDLVCLGKDDVRRAVSRGANPPTETFISGNVAALLWSNKAGDDDFVFKTELLYAVSPRKTVRFIPAPAIRDAKRCYEDASSHILKVQATIPTRK